MADVGITMKTDEIKKEVIGYLRKNPKLLQTAVLSNAILLNAYATTVTKVRGEYTSLHSLISHVVQGFTSKKFTPFGEVQFRKKQMRNYHQKFDFLLDPADILGTVLESQYDEGKKLADKTIAKHVIDLLLKKIISDVNILSIHGKYDASKIGIDTPEFGFSMDGLNEILTKGLANTDNPYFVIPGDAITENNILDVVTKYERDLPSLVKKSVSRIFMSENDKEVYRIMYEQEFGMNKFQDAPTKTRLGKREIVGLPGLTDGTIFSCVDNTLVKMVDIIDNPATITSVQEFNRILKILGEFTLGYDFAVNELAYVHTPDGSKNRGLNNADLNKLYYPEEKGLI